MWLAALQSFRNGGAEKLAINPPSKLGSFAIFLSPLNAEKLDEEEILELRPHF